MGECVKYRRSQIKIGTCESLYYVTFYKYLEALERGQLGYLPGNEVPSAYVKPDSGYRFRFPFPDEDRLPFGEISGDYYRGVPVIIDQAAMPDANYPGTKYELQIVQQKLVHRESDGKLCLALVMQGSNGLPFRIEDDDDVKKIMKEILKHHVVNADEKQKEFYRKMAYRILKGYRLKPPQQKLSLEVPKPPVPKAQRRKGRRL